MEDKSDVPVYCGVLTDKGMKIPVRVCAWVEGKTFNLMNGGVQENGFPLRPESCAAQLPLTNPVKGVCTSLFRAEKLEFSALRLAVGRRPSSPPR